MTQRTTDTSFQELRSRISAARGKALWRSPEALSHEPEFVEALQREFPSTVFASDQADDPTGNGVSRRSFLQTMGASLALAGLTGVVGGCSDKPEDAKIVPYVNQPEAVVPGRPLTFA